MKICEMKRVIVIGCPGSGKSVLSRELHRRTGLPLYHLDNLYWNADKTTVPGDIFRAALAKILERDAWIIDGNYGSTMAMRMAACDTVVFLDYPSDVCIAGIRSRIGVAREDIPWVETEEDPEFLAFVEQYREESRPKVCALLEQYADKQIIVLKSRDEGDAFLAALSSDSGKQDIGV